MNDMSREYELCECLNATFIFFVKHMYGRNCVLLAIPRPYHNSIPPGIS